MAEAEIQEQEEIEEQESQEQAESQGEEDKRVKGLEAAASNERKKRQLAEQEAERYRREIESLKRPKEPEKPKEQESPDLDAEFNKRWQAKEREKRIESWTGTMSEAQERFEGVDLGEALNEVGTTLGRFGQAGTDIADQIIASDKSWDVLAHLHQNPETLHRLSQMGPVAAAVEIGRLESKVGGSQPERRVSSAPDPIRPNSSSVKPSKDPDKMSLAEYEQYVREKRGGSVWPK